MTEPRVRTAMLMMLGVGAGLAAIAALVSSGDLDKHQDSLTKEVARMRGQVNIGLRELAEAVERVEARVTADIVGAYDLGAQSARS